MNKSTPSNLCVLHVDTGKQWRGGQNQVALLARTQKEHGDLPVVVAAAQSPLSEKARNLDIPVVEIPFHGEFDIRAIKKIRELIRLKAPHCIHSHTAHALTLSAAARLFLPSVPHVHSRRVDFHVNRWSARLKYVHGVDHIIAVSAGIKSILIQDGIPEQMISVIHSGIDPTMLKASVTREAARQSLQLTDEHFVIGSVAHLTDHKGHTYLLDAAREVVQHHSHVRFVLVGDGELRGELQQKTQQLGLEPYVIFAGFRKDVPDLLQTFDIFVMSSHLEGLCTSLLDAMAFRLPIVATNVGGIPEVVKDGKNGLLVPARDGHALAEALLRLIDASELRVAYGAAGNALLHESFHIKATSDQTRVVYESLIPKQAR